MNSDHLLLETGLLAGRIMMESGSEVYRVEDTMNRIAHSFGHTDSVSYVTATGIFFSLKNSQRTQLENVGERSNNLDKVAAVNQLSRDFSQRKITLEELNEALKQVDQKTPVFSLWVQVLCAGITSSTLMYIFNGTWADFIATFFIGCLGFIVKFFARRFLKVAFLDHFVASFVIGFFAILAVHWHLAFSASNIIIGSVMPLVPGVAITNSFRDFLSSHLISGLVRGTEAMVIAVAIGVGIATSLIVLGGIL